VLTEVGPCKGTEFLIEPRNEGLGAKLGRRTLELPEIWLFGVHGVSVPVGHRGVLVNGDANVGSPLHVREYRPIEQR
jgi:hypothetical protein